MVTSNLRTNEIERIEIKKSVTHKIFITDKQ